MNQITVSDVLSEIHDMLLSEARKWENKDDKRELQALHTWKRFKDIQERILSEIE